MGGHVGWLLGAAKGAALQESMCTWDALALLQRCCLVLVLLAGMLLVSMPREGRLLPMGRCRKAGLRDKGLRVVGEHGLDGSYGRLCRGLRGWH